MLARCGRAAHICEANKNCMRNYNKNLGENRKESQLPLKLRGCNEIQDFRGNCGSQGKLGMCPSLAEPNSGGFPRSEVSNYEPQATKSFLIQQFFKNVGEVQGEQP